MPLTNGMTLSWLRSFPLHGKGQAAWVTLMDSRGVIEVMDADPSISPSKLCVGGCASRVPR
jgi:hypothetical protein